MAAAADCGADDAEARRSSHVIGWRLDERTARGPSVSTYPCSRCVFRGCGRHAAATAALPHRQCLGGALSSARARCGLRQSVCISRKKKAKKEQTSHLRRVAPFAEAGDLSAGSHLVVVERLSTAPVAGSQELPCNLRGRPRTTSDDARHRARDADHHPRAPPQPLLRLSPLCLSVGLSLLAFPKTGLGRRGDEMEEIFGPSKVKQPGWPGVGQNRVLNLGRILSSCQQKLSSPSSPSLRSTRSGLWPVGIKPRTHMGRSPLQILTHVC